MTGGSAIQDTDLARPLSLATRATFGAGRPSSGLATKAAITPILAPGAVFGRSSTRRKMEQSVVLVETAGYDLGTLRLPRTS